MSFAYDIFPCFHFCLSYVKTRFGIFLFIHFFCFFSETRIICVNSWHQHRALQNCHGLVYADHSTALVSNISQVRNFYRRIYSSLEMCYLSLEDLPTTLKKYWAFEKQDKFQDFTQKLWISWCSFHEQYLITMAVLQHLGTVLEIITSS